MGRASPPLDEPRDEPPEEPRSLARSAILFARDVAFAFLVVAVVFAGLVSFTQNPSPMVVVESESMQHADRTSYIGAIDTGDLVLVQRAPSPSDVVTYVQGRATGHQTYGAYGDVIIFLRPGDAPDDVPIIHRAIVYVVRNGSCGDVPSLAGQPGWSGVKCDGSGPATEPFGLRSVTILGVLSWDPAAGPSGTPRDLTYPLQNLQSDGFLTKGDHNGNPDPWGPVAIGRVNGKARGELPWFGLIKLSFAPSQSGCCPRGWGDPAAPGNSWDSLLLTIVVLIFGPFGADFAWSAWRERRPARKGNLLERLFPARLTSPQRRLYLLIGLAFVALAVLWTLFGYALAGPVGLGLASALTILSIYTLWGTAVGGFRREAGTPPGPPPAGPRAPTDEPRTGSSGPEGGDRGAP